MKNKDKINLIGIYLFLILTTFVLVAFFAYFKINTPLFRYLVYATGSGGIGGTLYSIRGFYQNLGACKFKLSWTWWYLFRPIIGAVAGVFAYFLIAGGLSFFGTPLETSYSRRVMFYLAVSFLGGFSFTQFADGLEKTASTIFSKKVDKT